MKSDINFTEEAIIKFAAESYVGVGGNPVTLFIEAAEWLYKCYKQTGDQVCLKAAKQLVNVYMQMGLLYTEGKEIFEKILGELGTSFEMEYPARIYSPNIIKNKVLAIREVLGFWPKGTEQRFNADCIARDIFKKVKSKELGCYCYGKKSMGVSFELLILENDMYLMDLERHRIYVFKD